MREWLRIASQVFSNAGHTDNSHTDPTVIKNASGLLHASHFDSVGFVDDQQRGRIGDQAF